MTLSWMETIMYEWRAYVLFYSVIQLTQGQDSFEHNYT